MAIVAFSRIREDAFLGLDLRTPENRIPAGYLREALNAEVVQGLARKRVGYAGYAGNMPARVVEVEYNDVGGANEICFTLDADVSTAAIDLLTARSSPLVVYGRLSANIGAGPFTTADAARYYSGWYQKVKHSWVYDNPATLHTLSIAGTTHGLGTADLFVEVAESTSNTTIDNQSILWDNVNIDEATADVNIDYYNNSGTDKQVYVYLADQSAVTGESYVSPLVTIGSGSTVTSTITAATHQLANFNIVPRVYRDNGTTRDIVSPDQVTVNPTTGQVQWTLTNGTGSSADYFIILAAAPSANTKQGSWTGGIYIIELDAPTSPFIFPGIYVTNGALLEQVIPESLAYDSANDRITLIFDDPGNDSFTLYWIDGQIRSTQICVADTAVTASGTDSSPQLTIWGLDQSEIYSATAPQRAGWVHHVDSYRTAGDSRIVAALGGVLYRASEYSESAAGYLYGGAYPNLFGRVASPHKLAPPFWETGENPQRTRGFVTGTGLGEGAATCTAVDWDSGVGATRFELTIPALLMFQSDGVTPEIDINNVFTAGDYITADSMPFSRQNGFFEIVQVAQSGNTIEIWADVPGIDTEDWDDTGCAGNVRVTTDIITLQSNSTFLPGDVLAGDALISSVSISCVSSSGVEMVVDGVTDTITLQTGVQLTGTRNSDTIPLRTVTDAGTATNFVRGDTLLYSAIPTRPLQILYINPLADDTGSISGDGTAATFVYNTGSTDHLSQGQRVVLVQAGVYTGTITITSIPDLSSFTFDSAETATESATVQGYTVQLGEEIEWADTSSDSNTITVARRMLPVEAPDDLYSQTPATHPRYFTYDSATEQQPVKSTMIADNLYLTNGRDGVMKFDGSNLYRAGLPRWQPGVFIQTDTATPSIPVLTRSLTILSTTILAEFKNGQGRYTAGSDQIPVGTTVVLTQGTTSMTTTVKAYSSVTNPAALSYIEFTNSLGSFTPGTTVSVSSVSTYKYYYRLNAVDANGNIITSAVAQSEDYAISLTTPCQVRHKLVGLPNWDNLDFDRIYAQVYRTPENASSTYYFLYQTQVTYTGADGYIEFIDAFSDSKLGSLDPTRSAAPAFGVNWDAPPRSRYLTSSANRLVLANIQDWPELDIQFTGNDQSTAAGFAGTILTFRRDVIDTSTTMDMVNRTGYEFVDGTTSKTIALNTDIVGVAGTSFTVTTSAVHSLSDGDWVYLYYSTAANPSLSGRPLTYAGWWQVYNTTPTAFTVRYTGALAGSPVAGQFPDKVAVASGGKRVPVLHGNPAVNPDGNSGTNTALLDVPLSQAGRRLALAINASMRMVDLTQSAYSTFTPWIIATGGSDTAAPGRVLVRQPRVEETALGMRIQAVGTGFSIFVNNTQRYVADAVVPSASAKLMPSRILVSVENYPELFVAPFEALDSASESAIDINPSDGQEITGVIPFFGSSAFGAAQQSGVVVVFKEESIYLVDIAQKKAGGNAVQRIETEGIGCTAPNSIAVTKGGIMFANQAGVYMLTRNLTVEYVGWAVERKWLQSVNREQMDLVTGHHFSTGKQYKLSIPTGSDNTNTEVLVYDHSGETAQLPAAWTRYDNHPATGWCNLGKQSFFGSTTGRVYVVRDSGEEWDYQDNNSVYTFRLRLRANDFGIIGSRKVFGDVSIAYRSEATSNNTVASAVDTSQDYQEVTGARIQSTTQNLTGLGDTSGQDVVTVIHSLSTRKGVSLSVAIENSNALESVDIAGIEYLVRVYGDGQGVKQAVDTP